MKITFAYWGNYTPAFKILFEKLGLEVVPPEKTNQETIKQGVKLSPELYCFPLKVNVGNYLSALKKGADTIFMWENLGGNCRFRYYWIVEQKVLNDAGFKVKVINLNANHFLSRIEEIKKANQISWLKVINAFYSASKRLRLVEKLEKKAAYLRPREKIKGETDRILDEAFKKLDEIKKEKEFGKFKKETETKLSKIKIRKKQDIPKIALIGEIFTVSDNATNFDLEKKLGQMGIEVHREMSVSYFLKHGIFRWKNYFLQKRVNPYLKSTVGGHGRDAINEMLDAVKKGFDGVIQLLPFGCMPEVMVRPILEKIHQEKGIPFLSLSLDEQVAEAGINTRLEAFVDVIENYHSHKKR